jgi:putative endonuclease
MSQDWFVYILSCADHSLYTGITTDIERRLKEHNSSTKGAKYTRGRRPVTLAYSERCDNRSDASKREAAIKKLPLAEKQDLIRIKKIDNAD